MKLDYAEIGFVIVFAATGLLGLAAIAGFLPADGWSGRWVDWVAAFGGWAGAAIAVPSWIILRQQAKDARVQAAHARFPAIQHRVDELTKELGNIDEIEFNITSVSSDYIWHMIGINRNSYESFFAETAKKSGRVKTASTKSTRAINYILTVNSVGDLTLERQSALTAIADAASKIERIQHELRDANRRQIHLSDEGLKEINLLATSYGEELEAERALRLIHEWRLAVGGQLGQARRTIDQILRVQH